MKNSKISSMKMIQSKVKPLVDRSGFRSTDETLGHISSGLLFQQQPVYCWLLLRLRGVLFNV